MRESKRVLDKWSALLCGSSVRELRGRAALLGTVKAGSNQYPETGSKTDFGP